jgi:hypothetical protein
MGRSGSGSAQIPLTNGSGSGRSKKIRIRFRNAAYRYHEMESLRTNLSTLFMSFGGGTVPVLFRYICRFPNMFSLTVTLRYRFSEIPVPYFKTRKYIKCSFSCDCRLKYIWRKACPECRLCTTYFSGPIFRSCRTKVQGTLPVRWFLKPYLYFQPQCIYQT